MSQYGLIIALLVLLALGIGAIGLMALLNNRADEKTAIGVPSLDRANVDDSLELHRRRVFLRRHPDWENKDYVADRNSPWYTDPEFGERNSIRT